MNKFSDRLKTFRKYTGLKQEEFALKIGVEQASISHWENGRNMPDLEAAILILKAFPELNVFWLAKDEGEMLIKANAEIGQESKNKRLADFYKKQSERFAELLALKGIDLE